ncbi:MAG TPA: glycosyltransferase family 4 protein [Pseudolysinimonas sp.]|nr:glycosyltransferase family 4 protein [Pseudolysinimonas sp.]
MTSSRRVVFIHSSNDMFGADRILLQVVDAAVAVGLEPEVWLPADVAAEPDALDARLRARGLAVRILPLPILRRRELRPLRLPGLLWRAVSTWARLVRSRPAIVYCVTSAALLAAPLARVAGVRKVILHNQEIWSGSEARVLGILARSCSSAVAISESARRSLLGPIAARSRTIVNAVPSHASPPPTPVTGTAAPLRFLVASRWNSWKGHATLLAAWDQLEPAPGVLTIVGSPPEVGIAVDVEALVAELRHPESVDVVGQVSDITSCIDASDYVIVPSDDPEPFGLVAIEAFSRCRAVIGTDGGGLAEVISHGVDGILVPLRDPDALAAALSGCSRERARTMGVAARATYLAKYSLERFSLEFEEFWRQETKQKERSVRI